jgi:hypothetical protein
MNVITRRSALAGATAATALAAAPGSAGADAVLHDLMRRWFELEATYTALIARASAADEAGRKARVEALETQMGAILDRQHAVFEQIAAAPAHSWAGIAIKLRIAAAYMDMPDDLLSQEQRLARSALKDAERLLA